MRLCTASVGRRYSLSAWGAHALPRFDFLSKAENGVIEAWSCLLQRKARQKVWLPIASRRNDQGPYLARQWQFCVLFRIAPIAPRRVRLPLCLLRRRNLLAVQSIWCSA